MAQGVLGKSSQHIITKPLTILIDTSGSTYIYTGYAPVGSNTTAGKADSRWLIARTEIATGSIDHSGGVDDAGSVWDDRAGLSYS